MVGVHVCGGRGKYSRQTPHELVAIADRVGFDGSALANASRLVAKVDCADPKINEAGATATLRLLLRARPYDPPLPKPDFKPWFLADDPGALINGARTAPIG
jgi:hypothetical protein